MNWKHPLKASLLRSRVLSLAVRAMPASVAILRYHSVQPSPERFSTTIGTGIIHSAAEFEAHMALVRREFVPVTLDQILQCAERDEPLPRRAVAITFDDGFQDNLEIAAPILQRFDLKAAFYVSVGWIGSTSAPWFCRLRHAFFTTTVDRWNGFATGEPQPLVSLPQRLDAFIAACHHCATLAGETQAAFVTATEQQLQVAWRADARPLMMDWDGLRELQNQGHIVGSHTVTHPNVAHVDEQTLFHEMAISKATLEARLGTPIHHFSYPSPCLEPHWSDTTNAIAQEVGYRTAVTCQRGAAHSGNNLLCLPRLVATRDVTSLRWDIEASFLRHRP